MNIVLKITVKSEHTVTRKKQKKISIADIEKASGDVMPLIV